MNPFDILPRNLTRPVDAQGLRESSVASEGADGSGMPAEAESFGALLQGLSGRSAGNAMNGQVDPALDLSEQSPIEADTGNPGSDIASAVFVLLQGILPGEAASPADPSAQESSPERGGAGPSDLEDMLLGKNAGVPSNIAAGQKLLVSVQHQETHFRPVLETSDAALAQVDSGDGDVSSEVPSVAPEGRKMQPLSHAHRQVPIESQIQPRREQILDEQPLAAEDSTSEDFDRDSDGVEGLKATAATSARNDNASLQPATLHRLAAAVANEIQSLAKAPASHSVQAEAKSGTISIKASESVLRVLKLQLHPAELGVVTVKMKLAGDGLEMELHAEREETAQLLRHDSEKLSSLLRGAGYKPEAINIQVVDPTSQDRNSLQRGQSDFQMQNQSSHQGGGHQGERYRNREGQGDVSRAEQHKVSDETGGSSGRPSGSVYL